MNALRKLQGILHRILHHSVTYDYRYRKADDPRRMVNPVPTTIRKGH